MSYFNLYFNGLRSRKKFAIQTDNLAVSKKWFFSFATDNEPSIIPFEIINGWIVLNVKMKLGEEYLEHRFVFDTGATTSIDFEEVKGLGLPIKKYFNVKDANGISIQIPLVNLQKLKIGTLTFSNVGVLAQNMDIIKCTGASGVIGYNLLYGTKWRINFDERKIYINRNVDFDRKQYDLIKIEDDGQKMLYINVDVDGLKVKSLVDTGFPNYFFLNMNLVPFLKPNEVVTRRISYLRGAHSSILDSVIVSKPIPNINVGKIALNKDVHLIHKKETIIGLRFLSTFHEVIIDLKDKSILLSKEQSKDFVPTEVRNISFAWQPSKLTISGLSIDGELWKMGLRLGNEVIKINNMLTSEFLDECSYKKYANEKSIFKNNLKLTVLRNSEMKEFDVDKGFLVTLWDF